MDEETPLIPSPSQEESTRKDWRFYLVWAWRIFIFAITGSSSVHVTRLLLHLLRIPEHTWYFYVAFFFAELVVYTVMIVIIGSLLFQWRFFCLVAYKMWSWALPPKFRRWCYEHLHSHRITL